MSDPSTSLQNLNDIVLPAPIGWLPPAPGWYAVAAFVAAVMLWLAWRGWRHWRRNRYRGQALRELAQIRRDEGGAGLQRLPALLKRAALSAWPRRSVAGLVGPEWHRFLDETGGTDRFGSGMGAVLDRLAYATAADLKLAPEDASAALDAAEEWLRRHRAPPADR